MYRARAIKVFIATPSDVAKERQLIREAIHGWNATHSEVAGIVLMPVGWETHAYPVMDGRPQGIVNKQTLDGCDLLVAVFWTRLGSPTGEAASGTVEEIREHQASGKPVMIYFSNEPVHPDSVDQAQYAALRDFRAECQGQGLIETYQSPAEFLNKFTRQLAQQVNDSWLNQGDSGEEEDDRENPGPARAPGQFPWPVGVGWTEPEKRLSAAGEELLSAAAADKTGTLMHLKTMGGLGISTNGRNFVDAGDPRSEAKWEGAFRELERAGLIQDRGHKDQVFAVTNEGYEVADQLKR